MAEPLLPVYELNLRSNEPLLASTRVVPLAHEAPALVRCSLQDSGFDTQSLHLMRNTRNVTQSRYAHSIQYTVNSFNSTAGEEIFDCSARTRIGKHHVRSLKFTRSRKPRLSNGDVECSTNHCRNGGLCLKHADSTPYCMCLANFTGEDCERSWDTNIGYDGERYIRDRSIGIASVGALILIALILAFLFCRERKKTRKLKRRLQQFYRTQNIDGTSTKRPDEDLKLEEIYDVADGNAAIESRPATNNEYDNVRRDYAKHDSAYAT